MTLSNSDLQVRIENIEEWINVIQTGLNNTSTRRELKNLSALITAQVTSLSDQVGNVDSTGVLYPPRYTTTERDALTSVTMGGVIYNTSLKKLQQYNGTSWETLTSA
jgi:hypothetical protein